MLVTVDLLSLGVVFWREKFEEERRTGGVVMPQVPSESLNNMGAAPAEGTGTEVLNVNPA